MEVERFLMKYIIRKLIFVYEDEVLEMDHSNILVVEYLNDYEFNHMAMLKLLTRIDVRKRIWLLKHKRKIKCFFELEKVKMDIDVEDLDYNSAKNCWDLEFNIHFNDEDESIDWQVLEERLQLNEGEELNGELNEENYYETQNTLDIYLFHPKLLKASRRTFNRVWTRNTLQNCVGEMLTDTKHVDILMSKFENDEIYRELLMPPWYTYKCLIYLDQYFGFYEKGAMIYYDIDTLYILNLNGKVTAKREEHGNKTPEWTETIFLIPSLDEAVPGNGMEEKFIVGEDDEKIPVPIYYPNISEMDINPQKFTIGKNVSLGSEAKMVITDDITIDIEVAEDASYIDERNEALTFIKSENKFTGSVIKARMEENECILYISAMNLDINAFTPNKTFKVNFIGDETKNARFGKNEYRMAYAYHYLKMRSGEYMDSAHRIVLKMTKKCESLKEDEESESVGDSMASMGSNIAPN
jgi:hypothetical protein